MRTKTTALALAGTLVAVPAAAAAPKAEGPPTPSETALHAPTASPTLEAIAAVGPWRLCLT